MTHLMTVMGRSDGAYCMRRRQELSKVGLNQFVLVLVLVLVLVIGCFRFPRFRCHRTECSPERL